ncbi:hypothetical protein ACFWAY_22725 [Rhodococcus sp. NPDC059968]|uniref:hypothetical protein n=1 Tax=Rhodococcus sp. NPDC059968 TaxID=3347017 RepID=UPI0036730AA0
MPTMHTIFDRVDEGTPARDSVEIPDQGEAAGFPVDRVQALRAHHDEAVQIASAEVYQWYITYLTCSAAHFGSGHIGVMPVTLVRHGTGGVPG